MLDVDNTISLSRVFARQSRLDPVSTLQSGWLPIPSITLKDIIMARPERFQAKFREVDIKWWRSSAPVQENWRVIEVLGWYVMELHEINRTVGAVAIQVRYFNVQFKYLCKRGYLDVIYRTE